MIILLSCLGKLDFVSVPKWKQILAKLRQSLVNYKTFLKRKGDLYYCNLCCFIQRLSTDFIISGSQDLTIKYWVLPKLLLVS